MIRQSLVLLQAVGLKDPHEIITSKYPMIDAKKKGD